MSNAAVATPAHHPLVMLVQGMRAILTAHLAPTGPSKADTIKKMSDLLDGPATVVALRAHRELVSELQSAEQIILVMLQDMTTEQKARAGKPLEASGISPDGMTRYHERRAVLFSAGAA